MTSAKIIYKLGSESYVVISLFDSYGNKFGTLLDERQAEGKHEFNLNLNKIGSGLYFIRMNTGSRMIAAPLVLVK